MPFLSAHHVRLLLFTLLSLVRLLTISALLLGITGSFVSLISALQSRAVDLRSDTPTEGGYYVDTDISTASGGVLGFVLAYLLNVLVLLLCLFSELPLPEPLNLWIQQGWEYAFKPFGHESGVGVLGALMLWIGSAVLGRRNSGLPRVAGWFLVVLGLLNLLLGLTLRSKINHHRSLTALSAPLDEESAPATVIDHQPPACGLPFFDRLSKERRRSMSVYSQETRTAHEPRNEGGIQGTVGRREMERLGPMVQVGR